MPGGVVESFNVQTGRGILTSEAGVVVLLRREDGGPVAVENGRPTVKRGTFVRTPRHGDNILLWLSEEEDDTIYATCWTYMEDWESAREYLADHDERPERAEDKPHGKY